MKPAIAILHRLALKSRDLPLALRYTTTALLVTGTGFVRLSLGDGGRHYPFLAFIPIILLCGAFLNRGNGLVATILSTAFCAYFIMQPLGTISVSGTEDQFALAMFCSIGIAMTILVELLHTGLVELATEHERTRKAVADRGLLLDELAHRTRNDFANVVTLLRLQSRTAGAEARAALVAAADRVQTIARVHRRLELRDDRVVVDTKSYIDELCADLRLSLFATRPIAIEQQAESHMLSLDKAVPLGLIINESATNAVKHAFPDDRAGLILVTFVRIGNIYRLTIADNGVGVSGPPRDGALGTRLMQMLAGQLDSRVEIEPRDPGHAVIVSIAVKSAP